MTALTVSSMTSRSTPLVALAHFNLSWEIKGLGDNYCTKSVENPGTGMLEVEVFEWPQFTAANRAIFEDFAQQLNNAEGYRFCDVTMRGTDSEAIGGKREVPATSCSDHMSTLLHR